MLREMGEGLPFHPQLPGILGMDFAGTVEAVGEGVTEYTVGDEVYGCAGGLGDLQGSLAEYMVADADLIAHKPSNLSMREAAAIPLVGITAYEGLIRAGVRQGQKYWFMAAQVVLAILHCSLLVTWVLKSSLLVLLE